MQNCITCKEVFYQHKNTTAKMDLPLRPNSDTKDSSTVSPCSWWTDSLPHPVLTVTPCNTQATHTHTHTQARATRPLDYTPQHLLNRCFVRLVLDLLLCVKRIWTDEEKAAVQAWLGSFFYLHQLPGKNVILQCMEQHPVRRNRQWRNIKDYTSLVNKKINICLLSASPRNAWHDESIHH